MEGYIIDYNNNEYMLPPLLTWNIEHTDGSSADSFEIAFIYNSDMLSILQDAFRFKAVYQQDTVFYGVIDEYVVTIAQSGMIVSMSGRGLAALLLDNEAEACQYISCNINDIISNHVLPLGITDIEVMDMPILYNYSVESGSSQYGALYGYTNYACGIMPRFSKEGKLILSDKTGEHYKLKEESVNEIKFSDRRYGVFSKVIVKDVLGNRSVVENSEFITRGGLCQRVMLVPQKTGADAMRFTGEYQIEQSCRGSRTLEITLSQLFAAFASDIIDVQLTSLGISGEFIVAKSRCWADGDSFATVVTLYELEGE